MRIKKQTTDFIQSRVCGNVTANSSVQLSCPSSTWFHVIGKISSLQNVESDNCSSANYPSNNSFLHDSSSGPALTPACRGRRSFGSEDQRCNESIQVPNELLSLQIGFFEVRYECINGKYLHCR